MDYFSTKRVSATASVRDGVDGMAITYQDGYQSWCPRTTFDRDYQPIDKLSFGHALAALKAGQRVCRAGWNGKGMWVALLSPGAELHNSAAGLFDMQPCIGMKTAANQMQPGWLASQADMLADDWQIVSG